MNISGEDDIFIIEDDDADDRQSVSNTLSAAENPHEDLVIDEFNIFASDDDEIETDANQSEFNDEESDGDAFEAPIVECEVIISTSHNADGEIDANRSDLNNVSADINALESAVPICEDNFGASTSSASVNRFETKSVATQTMEVIWCNNRCCLTDRAITMN